MDSAPPATQAESVAEPSAPRRFAVPGPDAMASALAWCVVAAGAGVLLGWYLGSERLTSVLLWATPMRPTTALCLLLLGGAALARGSSGRVGRAGEAAAGVAALLAGVTLLEVVTGADLAVDTLLPRIDLRGIPPRMATSTAVALVLLGPALLLARRARHRSAQGLAGAALLTGYVPALGYLYDSSGLSALGGYTSMALHTALSIVALAMVVLLTVRLGVRALLLDSGSAGRLVRVLLPILVIAPPVVGSLELTGQHAGWYDDRLGAGLHVIVLTVIPVALLVRTAWRIRHTDAQLGAALTDLSDLNRDLESLVEGRTEALAAARARFEAAFASSPLGSALTTVDGHVEEVNRLIAQLTGRSAASLQGLCVEDLFDDGLDLEDELLRAELVTARSGSYQLERRLRRPGTPCWVQVSVALVRDETSTRGLVYQLEDVTSRKLAEARAEHMALHDSLTDLPNRSLVLDRLAQALAQAARTGRAVGVLFIDLDRFKVVNDSLGHHAGDAVLVEVARRLKTAIRGSDSVARLGGDEFLVLCTDVVSEVDVLSVARTVSEAIRRPIQVGDTPVFVDSSVGIALGTGGEDPDLLVRQADQAMYRAKDRGRARLEVYDEDLRARVSMRLDTELALRGAVERDEIETWFQPIVDLETGAAVAAEALVRWRRPGRGLVLPDEFVQVAEEIGLIQEIGATVLQQATLATARSAAGLAVSVNVSARQLVRSDFKAVVKEALALSGLPPERLWLELTESAVVDAIDCAARGLQALRDTGVRVAIDDFGTGFSSFTHLRRFPVDLLKIDRTFVAEVERTTRDRAIVEGIVRMADALRLDVVAEGIETTGQRDLLRIFGCRYGQGFLYARPSPSVDPDVSMMGCSIPEPHVNVPQQVERDRPVP